MDDKLQEVFDRVRASVDGKPRGQVLVQINDAHGRPLEDDDGNPVKKPAWPLVANVCGDVYALCSAIPAKQRTQIVKDLRRGTGAVHPEREVRNKARCIWHLVEQVEALLAAPAPAATPAAPAATAPE